MALEIKGMTRSFTFKKGSGMVTLDDPNPSDSPEMRIKHYIQSVFSHSHTGIFAAPRPILIFKIIFGRKKNRAAHPLHLNPILTFSITNT